MICKFFKKVKEKVISIIEYNRIITMVDCYLEFEYTLDEIGSLYDISGKDVYNIFNLKLKDINKNAYDAVHEKMKSDTNIIRKYCI